MQKVNRSIVRYYSITRINRDLGAVVKPLKPVETKSNNPIIKQVKPKPKEEKQFDSKESEKKRKPIADATILW
jgi:hypothetical protein